MFQFTFQAQIHHAYSNYCFISLLFVLQVCFNCRHPGHQVSECPEATETGICFKCGAADHISRKCKVKVPEGEIHVACLACFDVLGLLLSIKKGVIRAWKSRVDKNG